MHVLMILVELSPHTKHPHFIG